MVKIVLRKTLFIVCAISVCCSILPTYSADKAVSDKLIVKPVINTALQPSTSENVGNVSLVDLMRSYKATYHNAFYSALSALAQCNASIVSMDTSSGEIRAVLRSGKEFYVLIQPAENNSILVRITPSNGYYDFPVNNVHEVFEKIKVSAEKN